MMRFKENNYNKLFVNVSDFIRLICGGDRLKRITNIIHELLKKEYLKKNKQLKILDYGCGSMEISKKLETKNYIKSIEILEANLGSNFINLSKTQCDEKFCYYGDEKGIYFADGSHLSKYGTNKFLKSLEIIFE